MGLAQLQDAPLMTALITPFTAKGEVDWDSFAALLAAQEAAGNSILLLGSTGEGLSIGLDERKAMVRFTAERVSKVPVVIGVAGFDLAACVSWVRWCQDNLPASGCSSFLLSTPLYAKPGRYGQTEWYEALLEAASVPCVLYNIPTRAAIPINYDTVSDLLRFENFYGIKEASEVTEEFKEYKHRAAGRVLYSGDDELNFDWCRLGAEGLVSVASNVWPRETSKYLDMCLDGTLTVEERELWRFATGTLFAASNPIPVKQLMRHLGQIKSDAVRPPLSQRDLPDLAQQLSYHEQITQWGAQYLG